MKLDGVAGRAFDPVEFVIGDRLSVQNWARALRTDDPAMLALGAARDAGWAGRPVPPVMYAFFLTLPNEILVDELGFVWGRTLAAGIKAESGRVAGEDEWVRGQTFADEADRLVNRWQTLFIEKSDDPVSVPQPEGAAPAVEPAVLDAPRSPSPVIPADGQLPSRRIGPLDRLDFARISVSLDDPNLVHLDEAVAANAGFGNVIGSGGYVLGALYEVARQWAGMDRIRSLDMRQLVPFPQGVELCATGTVATDGDASGESRLATVDAVVTDAGGQTIGTGTISVQL
jgi:acyl dehydratase